MTFQKMILSIVFGFAVFCFFLFLHLRRAPEKAGPGKAGPDPWPYPYEDPPDIKDILSGKGRLRGSTFEATGSLLQSRAFPNQRLVRAFNIDNAFTTTDDDYYRQFRGHAAGLLQRDAQGWKNLGDVARMVVRQMVEKERQTKKIRLVPLVQVVVLKTSIHAFFELPIDTLDDHIIGVIAETINKLWIASKAPCPTDTSIQRHQHAQREALKRVFPDMDDTPRGNPLNVILPAYETLWRVVLRCFVEVNFRSGGAGTAWHRYLQAFLSDPTRATFEEEGAGVSVKSIVAEALRLYPPTRRIYRQVTWEHKLDPEVVGADIERMHRDPWLWGTKAWGFRPSRWGGSKISEAYMPFGSRPFVCPAAKQFGPWMIGLLVAALAEGFQEGWTWEAKVREDMIDSKWPLSLERDSYGTVELCRVRDD